MTDEMKGRFDGAADALGDAADKAKEKAGELADSAAEKAGEALDDLKGGAADMAAGSEEVTEDLTDAARQAIEGIDKPE